MLITQYPAIWSFNNIYLNNYPYFILILSYITSIPYESILNPRDIAHPT
jgi:hypothetical protein